MENASQKITPCLWFNNNCEEAINFYLPIFPGSKLNHIMRYPEGVQEGPMKDMGGKVLTAFFDLAGHSFQALDGGETFKMNPSVSFFINFDPSKEPEASKHLEETWTKLSEGSKVLMELNEYPFSKKYGWLEDKFGVSWQLILTDPKGEPRPCIIPSLLFVQKVAGKAEEALDFYTSIFKNSKKGTIAHYPAGMEPDKEGSLMFGEANLDGSWLVAMDSAHDHKFEFTAGTSLVVDCDGQAEVDYFWEKLTAGGEESQCGWLIDKYGVWWQIIPQQLGQLMGGSDPEKTKRVIDAFMPMKKLDIAKLQAAYDGN